MSELTIAKELISIMIGWWFDNLREDDKAPLIAALRRKLSEEERNIYSK